MEQNLRGSSEILSYTDSKLNKLTFRAEKPLRQVQNQAANSLLCHFSLQNITDNELICRASKVLRKFYLKHEISLCLKNNFSVLNELQKLFRAFSRNPLVSGAW